MTGVSRRVWLRLVVALCVAVLGLSVSASASVDKRVPKCFGKKATIVGTNKSEKIKGTRKNDVIVAKGGNDTIKAKGGNDLICAGPGDDTVSTSAGDDRVLGEAGRDKLLGDAGRDRLDGGADDDTVDGGADADTLLGGDGKDTVIGGTGADNLVGGTGNDKVDGGADADVVKGGTGLDVVAGGPASDILDGGSDSDTVDGADGDDHVNGGAGNDTVVGGPGADVLDGGADDDAVDGGAGADSLLGGPGHDRLTDISPDVDSLDGGGDVDVCAGLPEDSIGAGCDFDQDDKVFFAPYQGAVSPTSLDLAATSAVPRLDVQVLVDRSGSMSAEITAIKNNLTPVVQSLRCAPLGTGMPPNCLDDIQAGAGTFGYTGSGAEAYHHFFDVQPNANFATLPTSEPAGCCAEVSTFAAWATITGGGGTAYGLAGVAARSGCPAGTYGYPCFRSGAIPVVVMATDEPPLTGADTSHVPDWATVVKPQFVSRAARFVGVLGSGYVVGTDTDLRSMATDTGAVDLNNAAAPIVLDGSGANAPAAVSAALVALIKGTPLDLKAVAVDDLGDAVNAVNAFVGHVETTPTGTPSCADVPNTDSDANSFSDTYVDTVPGTSLCWRVVMKSNTTVAPTSTDQVFQLDVRARVDGVSDLAPQPVFVVVPHA